MRSAAFGGNSDEFQVQIEPDFDDEVTGLRKQPSSMGVVTSTFSPQRPDPLAIDYGTIDYLCDLCVGYGAMPVLEEVLSSRTTMTQDQLVNQHTVAAVSRICLFCETHKHFNYLYMFQSPFDIAWNSTLAVELFYLKVGLTMSMLKLLDVLVQLDHLKNAKASIPNDFSWYKRTFTQVSVQWQDTDSMSEELDDL
ncbi:hypothetical protein C2S51_037250 [Perilla frutescens var. frutescens]|nr:hypothetical protein C2S51_037250 [Perilla frutescens var. frutescens]